MDITLYPPGTTVEYDDPDTGTWRGRVAVCLCKRHIWQSYLDGRECGHARCGYPPAPEACPWPLHVVWGTLTESHESPAHLRIV